MTILKNLFSRLTRDQWQDLGVAFSLSNLIFFKPWSDLLVLAGKLPTDDWTYEAFTTTPITFIALVTDVLLLGLAIWTLLAVCRKLGARWVWTGVHFILLASCFLFLNGVRLAMHLGYLTDSIGKWNIAAVALAIIVGISVFAWRSPRTFVSSFRVGILMLLPFLGVTFVSAASGLAQTLWKAHTALKYVARKESTGKASIRKHRIIWWLFDETDYRITFVDRPRGLNLPELDRLRGETFFSEQTFPPGAYTAVSIPSYLTGRVVDRPPWPGARRNLRVHYSDGDDSSAWDESNTLFSDMKSLGAKTALVGWYLPYCTMTRNTADECMRWPHYNQFKRPYSDNFATSLVNLASDILYLRPNRAWFHIQTYRSILAESEKLMDDPSYDFVFVHWPAPHAPWIYDREKGQLTDSNSKGVTGYFDNLALLDKTVGELRRRMEKSGEWDESTILLSTDHGWNSVKEYDGGNDHRIPFMVKLPHKHPGYTYSRPFNAIILRSLFRAIYKGEITENTTLATWLDTHTSDFLAQPHS
jgi:hypothetical protein